MIIHKVCTVQLKFNLTLARKDTRAFTSFYVELLNISRVIKFYSQFWCARACAFSSRNIRACMNTHFTSTLRTARVHSHARATS